MTINIFVLKGDLNGKIVVVRFFFCRVYFQIFWQNFCRKTIEATTAKKVPNERKLIYAIYNFIVASWCLLFSYCSHLNTTTNFNGILATLNLASMGIVKSY